MLLRATAILVAFALFLAPTAGRADLASYTQDFEGLVQSDPGALAGDGWLVFGNVFSPTWAYLYGYGVFPAPNGTPGFCSIDAGQGGPAQGAQQLVVYSDYNNGDHANGNLIEANVFRESTVGDADVGSTWLFTFDAKRGNIEGTTTAVAFLKTLDPAAGYATTNFITVDMTSVPDTWGEYAVSINIDAGLVGQIVQYGFATTTTNYQGAGIFYDNLAFRALAATVDLDPDTINLRNRGPWVTAYLELPVFDPASIDVTSLLLAGTVSPEAKFAIVGDHDGNQTPDLMVKFPRAALDPLLTPGLNTLDVTGSLLTGESFDGTAQVMVIDPPDYMPAASVSPNPLNPVGVLSFRTSLPGRVSVKMFDLNGRLVRTLLAGQVLSAGTHEVAIDGRGRGGESLSSGVYFYRVEAPGGVARGQFSIVK